VSALAARVAANGVCLSTHKHWVASRLAGQVMDAQAASWLRELTSIQDAQGDAWDMRLDQLDAAERQQRQQGEKEEEEEVDHEEEGEEENMWEESEGEPEQQSSSDAQDTDGEEDSDTQILLRQPSCASRRSKEPPLDPAQVLAAARLCFGGLHQAAQQLQALELGSGEAGPTSAVPGFLQH
jgi:hypothetical protein